MVAVHRTRQGHRVLQGHIGLPYGPKICEWRSKRDSAFTTKLPRTTIGDSYTLVASKVYLMATCGISFKMGPYGAETSSVMTSRVQNDGNRA
jgi:hypothetical protein